MTKKQLERQDLVDNEIFQLLKRLLPAKKKINWDIELISRVRNVISHEFAQRKLMTEKQFYPWM